MKQSLLAAKKINFMGFLENYWRRIIVSKKMSQTDRFDRMKKMEREAAAEKRRELGEAKKRSGRPKTNYGRNRFDDEEEYYF